MKEERMTQQAAASRDGKREFVKPELRREAKLPEITNAYVGSFDPGGDTSTTQF